MSIHKILPRNELKNEEILAAQEKGEIIRLAKGIYQVKVYAEPKRKIFTTSVERAFKILHERLEED
ncbi:MAG: hypothetical protein ACTSQE_02255 [Candidatus Heimdallarchaeaceae archaeon]